MTEIQIEALIKYVMAEADKCYRDDFPIPFIEDWIREYFKSIRELSGNSG